MTKHDKTAERQESGNDQEQTATPAVRPAAAKKKQTKTKEGGEAGFCMYLGPSIRGVIRTGTLYRGTHAQALEAAAVAVECCPTVRHLIVPDSLLPQARQQVKQPGNALYEMYQKAAKQLTGGI